MRSEPVGTTARSSSDVLGEGFLSFLLATGACLCHSLPTACRSKLPRDNISYRAYLYLCLYLCFSMSVSISLCRLPPSIHRTIYPSVHPSIDLSVHLPISLFSIRIYISTTICLATYLSTPASPCEPVGASTRKKYGTLVKKDTNLESYPYRTLIVPLIETLADPCKGP